MEKEKAVRLLDVARHAGVGVGTASRVLNHEPGVSEEKRQRVLRAIEELGYRRNAIARSLKVNRTKTLGVVIPDIANEFYCEIVRGAEDAARSEHYTIILCSTDSRPAQELSTITMLTEKQVDGVIMLSYDCCPQTLDALKRSGLPTALISTLCTDDAFITINISNFDAAYQAVEHLIKNIVDFPDDVSVKSHENARGELIRVRVNPEDIGRVIGRSGRTANAIRTVVQALADHKVRVDIMDVRR